MKSILILLFVVFIQTLSAKNDSIILPTAIVNDELNYILGAGESWLDTSSFSHTYSVSVDEWLASSTPVFIKNYGTGALSTSSLRGMSAKHTSIYWEDIPLNSPMLGQLDLSLLSINAFDNVGIVTGTNSLDVGEGGLGGVLKFSQNKRLTQPLEFLIFQGINSWANYRGNTNLSTAFGNGLSRSNLFWQIGKNQFSYKDKTSAGLPTRQAEGTEIWQLGFKQYLQWRIKDKHEISIDGWYQGSDRGILTPPARQQDKNGRGLLSWRYLGDKQSLSVKTAFLHDQFIYQQTSKSFSNRWFTRVDFRQNLRHNIQLKAGFSSTFLSLIHI